MGIIAKNHHKTGILIATNAVMAAAWLNLFLLLKEKRMFDYLKGNFTNTPPTTTTSLVDLHWCETELQRAVLLALGCSCLEAMNALLKITKSQPHFVLLFVTVRAGIELIAVPKLGSCLHIWHLCTVFCWSFEFVRFTCFTIDALLGVFNNGNIGYHVKTIRYLNGLAVFPFGTFGEVMILYNLLPRYKIGSPAHIFLCFSLVMWPAGFCILYKQLFKQSLKHYWVGQNNTALSKRNAVKKE